MRIEAYTQVQQLYNTKNTNKTKQSSKTSFSDQLEISSVGKDIQSAKQAVKSAPDVREEKVQPLKNSIQNGSYEVSGESFADRLIQKYNGQM